MTLPGTVTNVTNFGAFVDIGVHQDGLIHISELADQFVDDPSKVVSVGDVVDVRVIEVDLQRRRIGLSRRLNAAPKAQGAAARPEAAAPSQQRPQPQQGGDKRGPMKPRGSEPAARSVGGISAKGKAPQPNYTMDDLLAKFNQRK